MHQETGMRAAMAIVAATWGVAGSSSAQAQSITLYGIIDTGIEYLHNANSSGNSVFRIPTITGEFPSRWGLTGSEPLGDGYKAVFTLESGFAPGTGSLNQGGRLFGRWAFVGLDGPLGALTFGRQYSMILWATVPTDLLGPDIYGSAAFDVWVANPRSDNTIAYRKSFDGLEVGASYSFGRDASPPGGFNIPGEGTCAGSVPGDANACREWSLMLKYTSGVWGAASAYDRQQGGPGSAVSMFNGLTPLPFTSSSDSDSRLLLDAYARIGGLTVSAIWLNRNVSSGSATMPSLHSNQSTLEAQYQVTPAVTVDGMLQRIVNSQQDTRANMESVRLTYSLSTRTLVYAQYACLQNSTNAAYAVSASVGSTPGKGMNQMGGMVGIRHTF
jgi:predicted porin